VSRADGQGLAELGKIGWRRDLVDGEVRAGQRTGQAEYPPRLSLQQRQHVRPAQTHQHQSGPAVVLHGVDRLRGDAATVQLGQGQRHRAVPAESGTVQLDDRIIAPRVHVRLAAGAELDPDHSRTRSGPTLNLWRSGMMPIAVQPTQALRRTPALVLGEVEEDPGRRLVVHAGTIDNPKTRRQRRAHGRSARRSAACPCVSFCWAAIGYAVSSRLYALVEIFRVGMVAAPFRSQHRFGRWSLWSHHSALNAA
jgi:hypothetical protein